MCVNLSNLDPIRGVGLGIWERFETNSFDSFSSTQTDDISVKKEALQLVWLSFVKETLQAVAYLATPWGKKDACHPHQVWMSLQDH